MTTSLLVILLGIASSIALVVSALSVHRKRLLTFGIINGMIVATQYGLVGSWVGLTTLAIGLVWTVMMLFSIKHEWLNHKMFIPLFMVFHLAAFLSLTDWSHFTWVNILPLLGGWGGIIAIFFKEMIYTKSLLIALGVMWLVYELHNSMFTQMIGESLNMVANIVALTTLLVALKRGIPESQITDVIDTITTSVPVITRSIHLPHAHPKRKRIFIRHDHPESVSYARSMERR